MFRTTSRHTLAALALSVFATSAWAQTTLKLGHTLAPTSAFHIGAVAFSDELSKATKGRYKVEITPAGGLGAEKELVEKAMAGTVDLVVTSTGPVGNFVPEVLIVDIPFIFRDYAHARKVMDGPIGQELMEKCEAKGFIVLAWGENGFRHLTNNKRAVSSATDMKGLKLRTMENSVHMQAFRALGAFPAPMPFTELIPAIEGGTVDGQENPISVITSAKLGAVQKHLTLTSHVYSPGPIIIAPAVFNKLSDADKQAFRAAALVGAKAMRKRVNEVEKSGVEELRAQGVQVVTDVDRDSFQALIVRGAYPQYEKRFGAAAIERVRAVQ
jgi:TRAP-type transport system periplasmic protein